MAIDYAKTYESPISLDASRMIGTKARRPTLWTLGGLGVVVPIIAVCIWFDMAWLAAAAVVWALFSYVMAIQWGQRPIEYWLGAWARHRRLPRNMDQLAVKTHHASYRVHEHSVIDIATDTPRAVVEIEQTTNLRLSDELTLGITIKSLGLFLNGLRCPIQIVVRASTRPDGLIERHWYVAVAANDTAILNENVASVLSGLNRAGLKGRALNGGLFDALQRCWTTTRHTNLGPIALHRHRRYVRVDDDYVRGFLLAKMPRTVEPNWLAPLLDGDLPIDFSLWLDPTENADEARYLIDRTNEWETAQQLNFMRGGFRDPDLDDAINDAKRTRLLLRRRELRVFRASMGFVCRSKTLDAMYDLERQLAVHVREQVGDDALVPLEWEHDRAVKMVVPLGEPAAEWPLRTVTPALARAYPFSNSSLSHDAGVDVGTSIGSKRECRLNLFSMANPHAVVLGTTGAGKGYWIKCVLWRLLHAYPWEERLRVFILQTEKAEYNALADAMEDSRGEVITINSKSGLDKLMYPTGFLRPFRDLAVFDMTRMPADNRGSAVAWLLHAIESEMGRVRRRRNAVCVVDELGIVLESSEAAAALDIAYRRFRSIPWHDNPREVNRVAMIGASQRPSDLLNDKRGKVLADLSLTHLYLRQKSTELKAVADKLHLSPDEQIFIENADQGTGLLVADLARVGLHLYATETEKGFAVT